MKIGPVAPTPLRHFWEFPGKAGTVWIGRRGTGGGRRRNGPETARKPRVAPGMACSGGMGPMQVIWAGMVVVVQATPGAGAPAAAAWPGRPADHDAILNQVTAWL